MTTVFFRNLKEHLDMTEQDKLCILCSASGQQISVKTDFKDEMKNPKVGLQRHGDGFEVIV